MKLNPIISGWANYFNMRGGWTQAKKRIGWLIFIKLKKWVYRKHRNSSYIGRKRLLRKYFKDVWRSKSYRNKWTFFGNDRGTDVYIKDIQEIKVSNIWT